MGKVTATIDTLRMLDLRLQGLSYEEIGKIAGITFSGVAKRLERLEALCGNPEEVRAFRENRPTIYSAIQAKLLGEIVKPDKLEKLSGYQAAGMQHYFWEQERIEQGKSSANIAVLSRLVETSQDEADSRMVKAEIKTINVLPDKPDEESGS